MTGADIIGALMNADTDLLAVVPDDRIRAKALPDGISLPALLIRVVSGVDYQTLERGESVRVTERIAVTVRANDAEEQDAVIKRVRRCCAGKVGDVGGGKAVSILTAGKGPDVLGPDNSFEQTQDFTVSHVTDA